MEDGWFWDSQLCSKLCKSLAVEIWEMFVIEAHSNLSQLTYYSVAYYLCDLGQVTSLNLNVYLKNRKTVSINLEVCSMRGLT